MQNVSLLNRLSLLAIHRQHRGIFERRGLYQPLDGSKAKKASMDAWFRAQAPLKARRAPGGGAQANKRFLPHLPPQPGRNATERTRHQQLVSNLQSVNMPAPPRGSNLAASRSHEFSHLRSKRVVQTPQGSLLVVGPRLRELGWDDAAAIRAAVVRDMQASESKWEATARRREVLQQRRRLRRRQLKAARVHALADAATSATTALRVAMDAAPAEGEANGYGYENGTDGGGGGGGGVGSGNHDSTAGGRSIELLASHGHGHEHDSGSGAGAGAVDEASGGENAGRGDSDDEDGNSDGDAIGVAAAATAAFDNDASTLAARRDVENLLDDYGDVIAAELGVDGGYGDSDDNVDDDYETRFAAGGIGDGDSDCDSIASLCPAAVFGTHDADEDGICQLCHRDTLTLDSNSDDDDDDGDDVSSLANQQEVQLNSVNARRIDGGGGGGGGGARAIDSIFFHPSKALSNAQNQDRDALSDSVTRNNGSTEGVAGMDVSDTNRRHFIRL
jgi:hypothetical protein